MRYIKKSSYLFLKYIFFIILFITVNSNEARATDISFSSSGDSEEITFSEALISAEQDRRQVPDSENTLAYVENTAFIDFSIEDNLEMIQDSAAIGTPFFMNLTFTIKKESLPLLEGKHIYYDFPNKYFEMLPNKEIPVMSNGVEIGKTGRASSGDQFVELFINSGISASLAGGNEIIFTISPVLRPKESLAFTENDKETSLKFVTPISEFLFTILPHNSGIYQWTEPYKDDGTWFDRSRNLNRNPLDAYWEEDIGFWFPYLHIQVNPGELRRKFPDYKGDFNANNGRLYFYYFWGKTAPNGLYYNDLIALCIDLFHSLVSNNGGKYDELDQYMTDEGARDVVYAMHAGAMLAAEYGDNVGPGIQVSSKKLNTEVPLSFLGTRDQEYNQRRYLVAAQLATWIISTSTNLDEGYRLDLDLSDFEVNMSKDPKGPKQVVDLEPQIEEIVLYMDGFKDTTFLDEQKEPLKIGIGETVTLFEIPEEQQIFDYYIDIENSKGLENLDFIGADHDTGQVKEKLQVKALNSIAKNDVRIILKKDFPGLLGTNNGPTALSSDKNQAKALYSMPEEYKMSVDYSVYTTPKEIMLTKTDRDTGEPIEGVEFTLQYLSRNRNLWVQEYYEGKDIKLVTDAMGQIIINENTHPGLISMMLSDYNNESNVTTGYRFRESKVPDGYVDPEYPIGSNGQEPKGDPGDKFSVVVDMEKLEKNETQTLNLQMENDKIEEIEKEIELKKLDKETGKPLAGVDFVIQSERDNGKWDSEYKVLGTKEKVFTTDKSGKIIINEETYPGLIAQLINDYQNDAKIKGFRFREKRAPKGYKDPEFTTGKEKPGDPGDKFSEVIDMKSLEKQKSVTLSLTLENEKLDKEIIVEKIDKKTKQSLAGVEFVIQSHLTTGKWDSEYKVLGTKEKVFITDKSGKIIINEQTYPGLINQLIDDYQNDAKITDFRFREKSAPKGYNDPKFISGKENPGNPGDKFSKEIDLDQFIDGNRETLTLELANEKLEYELEITKVDDDGNKLQGAEFTLTSDNKELAPIVSKGKKGIFQFNPLYADVTYTLTETKAPDSYLLKTSPYKIQLTSNGEMIVLLDGNRLVEGKDYSWNAETLSLSFEVINKKTEMPVTGGIGTFVYFIIGLVLIGVAYHMYGVPKKIKGDDF